MLWMRSFKFLIFEGRRNKNKKVLMRQESLETFFWENNGAPMFYITLTLLYSVTYDTDNSFPEFDSRVTQHKKLCF